MLAINRRYRSLLIDQFNRLDTYSVSDKQAQRDGIEARMLKNTLLELIAIEDSEESHKIALDHFYSATTATDRVAALQVLNRSTAASRRKLLEEAYSAWHGNLSGYANYLRVVAGGTCSDVFDMIETEKNRSGFDIKQPTWSRALFLPMATNNKMVWTDQGIIWVADTVIELAPINATTTGRLLNTFQHVKNLKPVLREKVISALERILQNVSEESSPSVYGQARGYLKGI